MAAEVGDDDPHNPSQFLSVPNEVTEQILSYLSSYGELQQAKLVCKTWHSIVMRIIAQRRRILYESACSGVFDFETISQRSRIPPRYSHSCCVLDGSMYVFGGCSSSNTAFNDIYQLDLKELRWTKLRLSGPPPPPKECVSMVVYKSKIVLFGGWCLSPRSGIVSNARFHNGVNVIDVPSLTWTTPFQATDRPQPCERAGHAACVVLDQMIVFGGAQRLTRYNDVWMLDLNLMCWTVPDITGRRPHSRFGHSQMIMDNQTMIIVGGWGEQLYSDVWLLHLKTMTWSEVKVNNPELVAPQIWCHPAVKVDDRIIVFSSNENSHERLQAYILDCSQTLTQKCCTWKASKSVHKSVHATSLHSVVKARGEFFIFGGRSNIADGAWKVVNSLVKITPDR